MPPPSQPESNRRTGIRFNAWNLLLALPFLMLVTPVINDDLPRLWGIPFFYWAQFLFVPVGVVCTGIVYVMTRDPAPVDRPGAADRAEEADR